MPSEVAKYLMTRMEEELPESAAFEENLSLRSQADGVEQFEETTEYRSSPEQGSDEKTSEPNETEMPVEYELPTEFVPAPEEYDLQVEPVVEPDRIELESPVDEAPEEISTLFDYSETGMINLEDEISKVDQMLKVKNEHDLSEILSAMDASGQDDTDIGRAIRDQL